MDLNGRTVLITGASSGIGAATTREMSRRGATVVLVARRSAEMHDVARNLAGASSVYSCDVGVPDAVQQMATAVLAAHGPPDVVVNNAGAGRWLFIEETDPSEFLDQVAVPFHAAFLVTRAFIEPMLERASGRVVMVNSPAAYAPWPGAIGYACSRWGVRGFSESLAADLAGTGIGVTEVVAGHVDSDYFEANPGTEERLPALDRAMRRLSPSDVATTICDAVEREQRRVIKPVEMRMMLALSRLVPRLGSGLAVATGAKRSSISITTGSPR